MSVRGGPAWSRTFSSVTGASACLLVGACTSYRAEPIDPSALEAAWTALDATRATELVQEARPGAKGFDLRDGIDLAEAETTALFFNPSLRATRAQLGVPTAEAEHARRWEDPEFAIDAEYILDDVEDPWVLGAGLAITIPLSGRRDAGKRLAEARIEEFEAAVIGAEWALLAVVRQVWVELQEQRAKIALYQRAIDDLDTLIALAPKFKAAQALTVVDERLLVLQQRQARLDLLRAQGSEQEIRRSLIAAMGLHPDGAWQLLSDEPMLTVGPGTMPPVDAHPHVRIALAAYQVAEGQLELEVRRQYPDLRIGFGGGSDEGDSKIFFGLGLLPVPVWNRNRQGIAMAQAERQVSAAQIRTAVQQLVHERAAARMELETSIAEERFLQREVMPLVDQQVVDAKRLVGLGQLDLFTLVDSLEESRVLQAQLLEAAHRSLRARLRIQHLAGPTLGSARESGEGVAAVGAAQAEEP